MTGAEHYRRAEAALADAKNLVDNSERRYLLAIAQVHAGLALVQATLATSEYADWDASESKHETVLPHPAYL